MYNIILFIYIISSAGFGHFGRIGRAVFFDFSSSSTNNSTVLTCGGKSDPW